MKRAACVTGGLSLVFFLAVSNGCSDVVARPRSPAPLNTCPAISCEKYVQNGVKPTCSVQGRCEAGRPAYDFVLVVDVPTTSYFAAGRTFYVASRKLATLKGLPTCPTVNCVALSDVVGVSGEYNISPLLQARYGVDPTVLYIPSRVQFDPLAPEPDQDSLARDVGLPGDTLVADTLVGDDGHAQYQIVVPQGNYARTVYPGPAFERVPPVQSRLGVLGAGDQASSLQLGGVSAPLDDVSGFERTAHLSRAAGLAGFRAWLADAVTGARISSLVTLPSTATTTADALLDTVGQNDGDQLRANVNLVVAPPAGAVLPSVQSAIVNGVGFTQAYPPLPAPVTMQGTVIRALDHSALVGASLVFTSTQIQRESPTAAVTYLKYVTTATSDADGAYAVELPRGTYDVWIDPPVGSVLTRTTQTIDLQTDTHLDLGCLPSSRFSGLALTGDGRPLIDAEVDLIPRASDQAAAALGRLEPWRLARPQHTSVGTDGSFGLDVDIGAYDARVAPGSWTGFPNVVATHTVIAGQNNVAAVAVPAPAKIAYVVRGPEGINPLQYAVVRAFAKIQGHPTYSQIGTAITDAAGSFEILVPPQLN